MLSNKTIEVIRSQMKIMLALINGETEGAEKARKDIAETIKEFNKYIRRKRIDGLNE